jgi:hypothetical protein
MLEFGIMSYIEVGIFYVFYELVLTVLVAPFVLSPDSAVRIMDRPAR